VEVPSRQQSFVAPEIRVVSCGAKLGHFSFHVFIVQRRSPTQVYESGGGTVSCGGGGGGGGGGVHRPLMTVEGGLHTHCPFITSPARHSRGGMHRPFMILEGGLHTHCPLSNSLLLHSRGGVHRPLTIVEGGLHTQNSLIDSPIRHSRCGGGGGPHSRELIGTWPTGQHLSSGNIRSIGQTGGGGGGWQLPSLFTV
jgi:hypothetical protein